MNTLDVATRIAKNMHDRLCVKREHLPAPAVPRSQGWTFRFPCGITKAVTNDPTGLRAVAGYWDVDVEAAA